MRQPVLAAEKAHPHGGSRPRQGRVRESALWAQSLRAVGQPPTGTRWVVVADRGADLYEHLQQCHTQGLGFVGRAAQDRALVAGPAKTPGGRLFALALVDLREKSRLESDAPAEAAGLTATELRVLRH